MVRLYHLTVHGPVDNPGHTQKVTLSTASPGSNSRPRHTLWDAGLGCLSLACLPPCPLRTHIQHGGCTHPHMCAHIHIYIQYTTSTHIHVHTSTHILDIHASQACTYTYNMSHIHTSWIHTTCNMCMTHTCANASCATRAHPYIPTSTIAEMSISFHLERLSEEEDAEGQARLRQ